MAGILIKNNTGKAGNSVIKPSIKTVDQKMNNTEPEPLKSTELLIKDQEISRLLEALSIANQKIA